MDHAPDQHAHPHGHSHDHGHHHHGGGDYYLQQLLTVGICGAFGVVGLLMSFVSAGPGVTDFDGNPVTKLGLLLTPGFHIWVLIGSLVLLAITVIRGVALWKSVGSGQTHDHHHHDHHHVHKPGEKCDHPSHAHDHHGHAHKPGEACDHPSHAHDHDHGDHSADDHSHGNIYWRVVVLLFPIVIYLMGLPDGTFSLKYQLDRIKNSEVSADLAEVADKGNEGEVGFETLASAAYSPENRELFSGKTVTVKGQFKPLSETQFTLFFFKETCCKADQVPLKATCVLKPEDKNMLQEVVTEGGKQVQRPIRDGQKVSVTGKIQFTQDASGEWVTVLRVAKGGLKKK